MEARLTFWLRALVAFFAIGAVRKAAVLAANVLGGRAPEGAGLLLDRDAPLVIGILFEALLAAQILLRTRAGRFWGVIYLSALNALGLFFLVIEPVRLVELGPLARGQEVLTYLVQFAFLAHLAGRRSARILTR